jgi:hypothetical protein
MNGWMVNSDILHTRARASLVWEPEESRFTICSEVETAEGAEGHARYRRVDAKHDKHEGEPKQLDSFVVKPLVVCILPQQ